MRCVGGCVACVVGRDVHAGFWWGNLKEGDHIEDLGIDGRMMLKWILKKQKGRRTF